MNSTEFMSFMTLCCLFSLAPLLCLGLIFVVERHLFTVEVLAVYCSFDTVPSSVLTFRFHAVFFFDNSENCFIFIAAMNSALPSPFCWGGWVREVEHPTKFPKGGKGLRGPQLLEGDCWQRRG